MVEVVTGPGRLVIAAFQVTFFKMGRNNPNMGNILR